MGYFVKTQAELKFGQNPGFNEVLAELVPFLGKHGWKLLYGLQTIIGDLTEVVHLWEVENLDDVPAGMGAAFADEELGPLFARLPDLVTRETVTIMVKTPYSP